MVDKLKENFLILLSPALLVGEKASHSAAFSHVSHVCSTKVCTPKRNAGTLVAKDWISLVDMPAVLFCGHCSKWGSFCRCMLPLAMWTGVVTIFGKIENSSKRLYWIQRQRTPKNLRPNLKAYVFATARENILNKVHLTPRDSLPRGGRKWSTFGGGGKHKKKPINLPSC